MGTGSQGHRPLTVPVLSLPAFDRIGGYEQLAAAYAQAVPTRTIANTTCHLPRADAMHMFRDPYTADLPWTGMTFGLTIMATWYGCTDQVSHNITSCHLLAFLGVLWRVPAAHLKSAVWPWGMPAWWVWAWVEATDSLAPGPGRGC